MAEQHGRVVVVTGASGSSGLDAAAQDVEDAGGQALRVKADGAAVDAQQTSRRHDPRACTC